MDNQSLRGHAAMLGANIMWGMMAPIAKFVMLSGAVTPMVVTDMRIGGAMLLFWFASLFQKPEHVNHRDLALLLGAALLGIVFNQGSYVFGVSLSSPADASIITTSMPLWAMIFAAWFLKEPITGKKVMGLAAGACGALLLILGSQKAGSHGGSSGGSTVAGDMLVMFAQVCYALYMVLYKNFLDKYSLITIMKWMFTYAFICILPFSKNDLMATDWSALEPTVVTGLTFVVVCGTFISYMLVVFGMKRLRPTVAGMYNYIQPIVACFIAIMWGMDTFSVTKIAAIVLIFCGVYLVTISRSRKDMEAHEAQWQAES